MKPRCEEKRSQWQKLSEYAWELIWEENDDWGLRCLKDIMELVLMGKLRLKVITDSLPKDDRQVLSGWVHTCKMFKKECRTMKEPRKDKDMEAGSEYCSRDGYFLSS